MILYHGTTEKNLPGILANGLRPQSHPDSKFRGNLSSLIGVTDKSVYLSRTREMAEYYAEEQAKHQSSKPVIVTCNLSDLDINKCYPDDDRLIVIVANTLDIDEEEVLKLKELPADVIDPEIERWRKNIAKSRDYIAYRGTIKVKMQTENLTIDQLLLLVEAAYQEEAGGTVTHDGSKYDLNKLFKLTDKQPKAYFKVKDLEWIIKEDEQDRIDDADLSSPILVTEWKNKWVVLDGFHRLLKAVNEKVEELTGRVVSAEQLEQVKVK